LFEVTLVLKPHKLMNELALPSFDILFSWHYFLLTVALSCFSPEIRISSKKEPKMVVELLHH
jgi:hypothetical protein